MTRAQGGEEGLVTFAGPDGPSNLVTYSLACLGKSTVLGRALFRPNKKDMVRRVVAVGWESTSSSQSHRTAQRGDPELWTAGDGEE